MISAGGLRIRQLALHQQPRSRARFMVSLSDCSCIWAF
jgi:hypothetical protein